MITRTIQSTSRRYKQAPMIMVVSLLFFAVAVFHVGDAFQHHGQQQLPVSPRSTSQPCIVSTSSSAATTLRRRYRSSFENTKTTQLYMAIPTLDKWKVMSNGSVIGTVKNHPSIADGDVITTSPLNNPNSANRMVTVTTASGSKYKLLEPRGGVVVNAASSTAAQQRQQPQLLFQPSNKQQPSAQSSSSSSSSSSGGSSSFFGGWGGFSLTSNNNSQESNTSSDNEPSASLVNGSTSRSNIMDDEDVTMKRNIRNTPEWSKAVKSYKLTGTTVGLEDEYLLAGKPERSTSGKSNIWEGYKANDIGLPVDNAVPVCIKVSTNLEAISREYENYRKLSILGGMARTGRFVRCYEFFPVAGYDKRFRNQCALVMERGSQDLKSFLNIKGKLEGKELRDACIAATQCVQALHNAGLVWTDMKTENFVVMANGEVKGIDLESAMPVNDNPVDYSPEACPPEFATAFLAGDGPYFQLDSSYDIWSLGMLMLELATGRGYFDGKNPAQITKILRDMTDGSVNLDNMDCEDRLKDLIGRCLQIDARKRPNTAQILLHPYFLAGNPFSFLS